VKPTDYVKPGFAAPKGLNPFRVLRSIAFHFPPVSPEVIEIEAFQAMKINDETY